MLILNDDDSGSITFLNGPSDQIMELNGSPEMAENNYDLALPSENIPLSQMNNPVEENQFDHDDRGCFSKIKCLLAACFQGKKRDLDPERGSIENDRENIDEDDLEGFENEGKW